MTEGARGISSWTHNEQTFFIVANTKDESISWRKQGVGKMHDMALSYLHHDMYVYNKVTRQFDPLLNILAHYSPSWTSLVVNNRVFLVHAARARFWEANRYVYGQRASNGVAGTTYVDDDSLDSIVYEMTTPSVGFSLLTKAHDDLPILYPGSVDAFDINGVGYVVIGSYWNHDHSDHGRSKNPHKESSTYTRKDSRGYKTKVYRYDDDALEIGTSPVLIQSLVQEGMSSDWDHFRVEQGKFYLVSTCTRTIEALGHVDTLVYEFQPNTGLFVLFQRIPTSFAWDVEVLQFEGRTMLAIATGYNQFKGTSSIYERCKASGEFHVFQTVPSWYPKSFEFFHMDGVPYLALGNRNQDANSLTLNDATKVASVVVYQFDASNDKFVEFQRMDAQLSANYGNFVSDVDHQYIDGQHLLLVARGYRHDKSRIYLRNVDTGLFELHGHLWGSAAQDVETWSIGDRHYAMLSNHNEELSDFEMPSDSCGHSCTQPSESACRYKACTSEKYSSETWASVSSFVYEYDKNTKQYVSVQRMQTARGDSAKHFEIGGRHYLAHVGRDMHVVEIYYLGEFLLPSDTKILPEVREECHGLISLSSVGREITPMTATLKNVNIEGTLCVSSLSSEDTMTLDVGTRVESIIVNNDGSRNRLMRVKTQRLIDQSQRRLQRSATLPVTFHVNAVTGNDEAFESWSSGITNLEVTIKTPLLTIQEAVNRASASDRVLLQKGIFRYVGASGANEECGCDSLDPTKRRCNVNVDTNGKAVIIEGQGPSATDVVVDCDMTTEWPSTWSDPPVRAFVFHTAETNQTILRRMTLRNCRAHPGVSLYDCTDAAGGMRSSLTWQFSRGPFPTIPAHAGGAIAVVGAAFPLLVDLVVETSHAGVGGGIYLGPDSGASLIRVDVVSCGGAGGAGVFAHGTDERTTWRGGTVANNIVPSYSVSSGCYDCRLFEKCQDAIAGGQSAPGGLQQVLKRRKRGQSFGSFYRGANHYLISCSLGQYSDNAVQVFRRTRSNPVYEPVQKIPVSQCNGIDTVTTSDSKQYVAFISFHGDVNKSPWERPTTGWETESPIYTTSGTDTTDTTPLVLAHTITTNGPPKAGLDLHRFDDDGRTFFVVANWGGSEAADRVAAKSQLYEYDLTTSTFEVHQIFDGSMLGAHIFGRPGVNGATNERKMCAFATTVGAIQIFELSSSNIWALSQTIPFLADKLSSFTIDTRTFLVAVQYECLTTCSDSSGTSKVFVNDELNSGGNDFVLLQDLQIRNPSGIAHYRTQQSDYLAISINLHDITVNTGSKAAVEWRSQLWKFNTGSDRFELEPTPLPSNLAYGLHAFVSFENRQMVAVASETWSEIYDMTEPAPLPMPVSPTMNDLIHAKGSHFFSLKGLPLLAVSSSSTNGRLSTLYDVSDLGHQIPSVFQTIPKETGKTPQGNLMDAGTHEAHGVMDTVTTHDGRVFLVVPVRKYYAQPLGMCSDAPNACTNSYVTVNVAWSKVFEYMNDVELFVLVQRIPTLSCTDVAAFNINGKTMLVFTNEQSTCCHGNTKTTIWQLDEPTNTFVRTQEVMTALAQDVENFVINNDHFIFLSNGQFATLNEEQIDATTNMRIGPDETSFLLKFNTVTGLFDKVQSIPTKGAHSSTFFEVHGRHFLAIAERSNKWHAVDEGCFSEGTQANAVDTTDRHKCNTKSQCPIGRFNKGPVPNAELNIHACA